LPKARKMQSSEDTMDTTNWLPMTDEDWDWVNYGKLPKK
jgi:hypothetical protein